MVIRTRRQRILQILGLYAVAASAIAYFGFHAWHGDHGMVAKQQLVAEIAALQGQLDRLKAELESARTALAAAPALADPESWDVTCTSSTPAADGAMICNEGRMLEVSAPNAGQKMLLRIGAPTTHCSDITYVINRFPGGSTPIAMTRRLAPGEDQIIELAEGWAEEGTYITVTAM
ncbi:MAG: FtsB family cell division protein, partial [Tepidisphaerales bacterium]